MLFEQSKAIREKISTLTAVLEATEKLEAEVLKMKAVDWDKYANILMALLVKCDFYWAIKHFDEKLLAHVHNIDMEGKLTILDEQRQLLEKAGELLQQGVSPESEQGQALAKDWWDLVLKFSGGDMQLVSTLIGTADDEWHKNSTASGFIEPAINAYFKKLGNNPFEEIIDQ